MSTRIDYKFRINGNTVYDCATYSVTERVMTAMLVSGDVTQVRFDLSDITLIEILNNENTVEYSTGVFKKLVGANLRIGFGYDDEKQSAFDMIQVTFGKYDLEDKVNEIDSKMKDLGLKIADTNSKISNFDSKISGVDSKIESVNSQIENVNAQLNPVVDYNEMSLEEVREYKIQESKNLLKEYLKEHPITSTCHGNKEGTYSITEEKQSLMTSQYTSYKVEKLVNPEATLTWNETGKSCEEWTEEEFLQLIMEIKYRVEPLVEYQRKYEESIAQCTSKEDILAISLNYNCVAYREPEFVIHIDDKNDTEEEAPPENNNTDINTGENPGSENVNPGGTDNPTADENDGAENTDTTNPAEEVTIDESINNETTGAGIDETTATV